MDQERKPPPSNAADDPLEPSAEDEKKKHPGKHTEDERVRGPNTNTREEIREKTIPRKDN